MKKNILTRAHMVGFLVGWLSLTIIGIIVSTQFAIGALTAIGIDIPFSIRFTTTMQDIVGMSPLLGVIFGIGFVITVSVATAIAKWVKILPDLIFSLAGFAQIAITLILMKASFQITAIAATRAFDGFLTLCLVGALSGYIYHQVTSRLTPTVGAAH